MSTRPAPDPTKRIEELPDSLVIANRTFTHLKLLDPIEHQQRVGLLYEMAGECGCMFGGVLGVSVLFVYFTGLYLFPTSFPESISTRVWLGVGALIVGGAIGKLIGQLHAKRQFDYVANDIDQRVMTLQRARSSTS